MMVRTIVAAVIVAIGLSHPPAWAGSADETAIRALESRFAAAVTARDIDAVMKVYTPDVLVFDVIPPRQYAGAAAYRKDWEGFFGWIKGPMKFEIADLRVVAAGTLGYSHSIQRVTGSDTKGQPVDLTVRVTDIYRKVRGHWLIEHEHVSIPVDLDTGKPDMTSKP